VTLLFPAPENANRRPLIPRPKRHFRDRLMYLICWLVRADPEILAETPTIDNFQIVTRALLLTVTSGIALFTWGAFFGLFLPAYFAAPLTLLVVSWVLLVEQICAAAAGLRLKGILRAPGEQTRKFRLSANVAVRLALGGINAVVTSFAATQALLNPSITVQVKKDHNAENAAIWAAGERDKAALRTTILGSFDRELTQATAEVDAANTAIKTAQATRDTAAALLLDHQLKANCEALGGKGCRRGRGPEWNAARLEEAKAKDDQRRAESDIAALQTRLTAAEAKRDRAKAAFFAAETKFQTEIASKIDARVATELTPLTIDPLISFRALQQVFDSPRDGKAAGFYWHMLMTLLLVMEISYIACSDWLDPDSVYKARLISRTLVLGAKAAAEFRRLMAALYRNDDDDDPPPRPPLRLMPRFSEGDREDRDRRSRRMSQ
jgi:Domain of unknown function (DUF4407)